MTTRILILTFFIFESFAFSWARAAQVTTPRIISPSADALSLGKYTDVPLSLHTGILDLSAPGPDYVFEKDDSLPSLESVQSYDNQNKHLPEVPSAKEMETNGINLSEMNMLLLNKVEELTLYVIEQQKTNEAQSKEISQLKTMINSKKKRMKYLLNAILLCFAISVHAQTNSYPSSGNVKIFAVDGGWVEGISIVKPSGWSGVRIARNDPASGNYSGNWALGYNVNTGNDFSITTNYNGTQYDGVFHISNATRSIGIGTTSPSTYTRLNVVGGAIEVSSSPHQADASLHISTAYGQYNRLTQIQPTGLSKPGLNLVASTDASGTFNWWSWGALTSGSWALQPATSFAGSTGLFIDRDGNLSVGTTDPQGYKLAIAGKAVAEEMNVKLQGNWPDYVFEKDYALPSLESVQSYINQNKHLPEVPSAKEMEANGINLSEMNMLLLKKVEELTLYVIDLKKENDQLKKRVEKIENKK